MILTRVIPTLLVRGSRGLYKGKKFADHRYIGDPLNAVRIFNSKEVDELIMLDIDATAQSRTISVDFVQRLAEECFMPLAVGGGIRSFDDAKGLFRAGAEKVILGAGAFEVPNLIQEITNSFGSQSVVVSIDYKKGWLGKQDVVIRNAGKKVGMTPIEAAQYVEAKGAGEIMLMDIDREGVCTGYDIDTIKEVSSAVKIPVIAAGGAGILQHLRDPIHMANAHALSVGSMFVFHGPRQAVLISFPSPNELQQILE